MTATSTSSHHQGWWLWSKNPLSLLLWPLSLLFCSIVWLRHLLYQYHILKAERLPKPVIIIGNITVGGSGKTPIVGAVVQMMQKKGWHPAILTRGYKSDFEQGSLILNPGETLPAAGDEANMLSELCQCPVAIGADRFSAAQQLLHTMPETDVFIADDGLQHYALDRDIEIIVERQQAYGNGFCLPAGPLREPRNRIRRAQMIIDRDGAGVREYLGACWNLRQPEQTRDLDAFMGNPVYALAGIGFPQIFFDQLSSRGLIVEGHAFPDHHVFTQKELDELQDQPLLVTHKDAVKLRYLDGENIWVVPLELSLSDDLQSNLLKLLESLSDG